MPLIDAEAIINARNTDLLTYLEQNEPGELVRCSRNVYTTRTHDSLKISNGKWMWWSRGIGGTNALDYLIKVRGISFADAVKAISGEESVRPLESLKAVKSTGKDDDCRRKNLRLPKKSKSNDIIKKYLTGRGIDEEVIDLCIKKGLIFQGSPFNNLIFIGKDKEGKVRYASYRSTTEKLVRDFAGSEKRYSFRLMGSNKEEIHLFESAIDVMSYATILKFGWKEWHEYNLISLGGIYAPFTGIGQFKVPCAIKDILSENKKLKRIVLHLDNDYAGRTASDALKMKLHGKYEVVDSPPPKGKDVNDFLCITFGIYEERR